MGSSWGLRSQFYFPFTLVNFEKRIYGLALVYCIDLLGSFYCVPKNSGAPLCSLDEVRKYSRQDQFNDPIDPLFLGVVCSGRFDLSVVKKG